MRKIILVLILFIFASFSLNISSSLKDNQIIFTIDGKHYENTNLSLFIFKNNVQITGIQKNNVILPYYYFLPYNESATYELRITDQKGEYANKILNVTVVHPTIRIVEKEKPEEDNTGLAIIIGVIGLLILVFITLSFIKHKSHNK